MPTLPDHVGVPAPHRPTAQVRVAPLTIEDPEPARLVVLAAALAHGTRVTAALIIPVHWPRPVHHATVARRPVIAPWTGVGGRHDVFRSRASGRGRSAERRRPRPSGPA